MKAPSTTRETQTETKTPRSPFHIELLLRPPSTFNTIRFIARNFDWIYIPDDFPHYHLSVLLKPNPSRQSEDVV